MDEAREAFERCLTLQPDFAPAIASLAFIHLRQGELERALDDISRALELRPENDGDLHNRAVIFTAMGCHQDAIRDYERALELNPQSGGSHNNLAWLLATTPDSSLRDGRRGVTHARRALETGENGAWLDTLATALAETGDFEQAAEIEQRALAVSQPTNESFRQRLELYRRRTSYATWQHNRRHTMQKSDATEPAEGTGRRKHRHRKRPHGGNGLGPGGTCVCDSCGHRAQHHRGQPCALETCPQCGASLERA